MPGMRPPVLACLCLVLLFAASAVAAGLSESQAAALVAAKDRSEQDRERDARRQPAKLLVFSGVGPGMRAADIGAGNGYTSELLARAVGPEGVVYGHNTPTVLEKYVSESWPARLGKDVNAKVVRIDAGFEDPLTDEAVELDVITLVFVYHDAVWNPVDRPKMNANLLAALEPGGSLIVIDHHAKPGSGPEVAETLHRIDEAMLRRELEAAGFEFVADADFMRNPDDPREKAFFDMKEPTDAFVHRYRKPE